MSLRTWKRVQGGDITPELVGTYRESAIGNNRVVIVGDAGLITVSKDKGKTWTDIVTEYKSNLYTVAFGGGKFIASGKDGLIILSEDGETWREPKSYNKKAGVSYESCCYSEGQYFVGGIRGTIQTSVNGDDWVELKSGYGSDINEMCAIPGGVMAVGNGGYVGIYKKTWVWKKVIKVNVQACCYHDGIYLIGGGADKANQLFMSTDGDKWKEVIVNDDAYYMKIYRAGAEFIACGDGNIPHPVTGKMCSFVSRSKDGLNWTREVVEDHSTLLTIISTDVDIFAAGTRKMIISSDVDDTGVIVPPPPPPPPTPGKVKKIKINGAVVFTVEPGNSVEIIEA